VREVDLTGFRSQWSGSGVWFMDYGNYHNIKVLGGGISDIQGGSALRLRAAAPPAGVGFRLSSRCLGAALSAKPLVSRRRQSRTLLALLGLHAVQVADIDDVAAAAEAEALTAVQIQRVRALGGEEAVTSYVEGVQRAIAERRGERARLAQGIVEEDSAFISADPGALREDVVRELIRDMRRREDRAFMSLSTQDAPGAAPFTYRNAFGLAFLAAPRGVINEGS